jgi:hypothetical protein
MAAIKPGAMGSRSDADKPADFAGSMAEAMENAFNASLSDDGMKTFHVDTNTQEARDRRRIFVAIATGLVQYLKHNSAALEILNAAHLPTGETIVVHTDPTTL